MKAGQVLSRRPLISDAIVPRDTPRREHRTSTPYGLKRVAGAIGKQISALRATVAKFKNTRRRDDFRYLAPSQTNPPPLAEQSKATKGPLLPASSFRSPKEGPQLEKGPFRMMETQSSPGRRPHRIQGSSQTDIQYWFRACIRRERRGPTW